MKETKALIFDLDGVLWDSNELHEQAFVNACRRRGFRPPDYFEIAGMSTPQAWKLIASQNGASLSEVELTYLTEEKRARFLEAVSKARVRDGDLDEMEKLFPGIPWAIVTGASASTLNAYMGKTKHSGKFSVTITSDDNFPSKPDPSGYSAAISRLRVEPRHALIFEDSPGGIRAAVDSGSPVVHVTNCVAQCGQVAHKANAQIVACVQSIRHVGFSEVS
jgi:beta-phosphoglucomutase-like phosphatase (HAD superfamily)